MSEIFLKFFEKLSNNEETVLKLFDDKGPDTKELSTIKPEFSVLSKKTTNIMLVGI